MNATLHAVNYRQTHEAALKSIVDPRSNLVFVHWNIPHPPAIYDAAKDVFSDSSAREYLDNLRLVDRTVRDVRLELETAGLWKSSTILLTSDHPLRVNTRPRSMLGPMVAANQYTQASKVPFLLKMAGEKQGFAYSPAMQTIVTKDLLLAILKGEINQPEQVAQWLDQRSAAAIVATSGPSRR